MHVFGLKERLKVTDLFVHVKIIIIIIFSKLITSSSFDLIFLDEASRLHYRAD